MEAEIKEWTDHAVQVAARVPAAAVVVVGGVALLAMDAFGVGEVLTAGVVGYVAYRMLRKRARASGAHA